VAAPPAMPNRVAAMAEPTPENLSTGAPTAPPAPAPS
jgi:hypothetical protein